MRAQKVLRAFSGIYVRSESFTCVQHNLRAFSHFHIIKTGSSYEPASLLIIAYAVDRNRFGDVVDDPARADQADR